VARVGEAAYQTAPQRVVVVSYENSTHCQCLSA
jgi:hypothetical protein